MWEVDVRISFPIDEPTLERLVDWADELGIMLVAASGERELHLAGDGHAIAEFVIRFVDVAG